MKEFLIGIILGLMFIITLTLASKAYADAGHRPEPNVLICQQPGGKLFFIFLNDNIVISKHIGKNITCIDVMDTDGKEHQFCNVEQTEAIKCRGSLGYQL